MRRGIPDLLVPVARRDEHGHEYVGLSLELKVGKNTLTDEQKEWLTHLRLNGWQVLVAFNDWRIAANTIARYLGYDELVMEVD